MSQSLSRTGMSKSDREGDLHNFSRVWTQLALELLGSSLRDRNRRRWICKDISNIQQPKSENFWISKQERFATCALAGLPRIFKSTKLSKCTSHLCVRVSVVATNRKLTTTKVKNLESDWQSDLPAFSLSMIPWFFTGHCMNWPWTNHWSHAWRTSWCANVTGLKRDLSPRFIKIHRTHRSHRSQVLQFCFKMFPRFQWIPVDSNGFQWRSLCTTTGRL